MSRRRPRPQTPELVQIPPKYQEVWRRLIKAERALQGAIISLEHATDYLGALRNGILDLAKLERETSKPDEGK